MNGLWWLLLLCCCGNKGNSCNNNFVGSGITHCHHTGNASCIQPRKAQSCDLNERETAWTPYVGKNKQEDCDCDHSH